MFPRIHKRIVLFIFVVAGLVFAFGAGSNARAQEGGGKGGESERRTFFERIDADIQAGFDAPELPAMSATPCTAGFAGIYPCSNIDLLAFMPLSTIGGGSGNDIWGWTDPLDGKEYALMGRSSGTAFVDISDPENPVYLGNLPTHTSNSSWRDIKVYNNYAFVVCDVNCPGHGMQVFDLTRLRNVANPPETFTEDAHFDGFGLAHNLVINEATGYAYKVGGSTCSGGLHFVNIQNPLNPTDAGCYSGDGYTHDAQCVNYTGPDADYQGDEVCFAYNEDTLTIVDVTNKNSPVMISKKGYAGVGYTHQGWITEDQVYLLLDDELDESNFGHNTRTRMWDISDLDNPTLIDFFDGPNDSIDHNLYLLDGYAYESNYTSGLQIMDLVDVANGNLSLKAFFDTYPSNNATTFNGSWSNYPYFESGVVIVSDINSGLFILRPTLAPDYALSADPPTLNVCVAGADQTTIDLLAKFGYSGTVDLTSVGLPAGSSTVFTPASVSVPGSSDLVVTVSTTAAGNYSFDVHADDGSIQHDLEMSLDIFSGSPAVPGLVAPANGAVGVDPEVTFSWNAVAEASSYTIEVATDSGFTNVVDSATVAGTSYPVGVALNALVTYYWRVSAVNFCGSGAVSTTWSFTTSDIPPILLVDDDDNTPDVRSYYTDALDALGWDYDVYDTLNSDNEPTANQMSVYDAVIWFTGSEFSSEAGPGSAGETALETWLDAGGCFFISSQDYRYDKGVTAFMTGYLGVTNVTNDDGNYTSVTGQNVFAGLGPYTLEFPPNFDDFTDPITVGNGGLGAFLGENAKLGAVTKDSGDYRTTFWTFPWEALPSNGREASLGTFLDWCDIDGPPVFQFDVFLPVVKKDP